MAAVALNAVMFAIISWASFRHFQKGSRSQGNAAIRLATLIGTITMVVLSVQARPVPTVSAILASLITLLALVIFVLAIRETRAKEFQVAFTGQSPPSLVTTGIYSIIRNPMYTSYGLYWMSWWVLTGVHLIATVMVGAFLVAYWWAAHQEERVLLASFGDDYRHYRSTTGRFAPKPVWSRG